MHLNLLVLEQEFARFSDFGLQVAVRDLSRHGFLAYLLWDQDWHFVYF